ncbi:MULTISPECIES: hypothetical protein [Nostocales]|uniref:Uncharacterized protein n=3 Tax=Nostocales TaxID=1161 RepID=A0A8S9SVS6_9CYAN|nr:hypothetical protein [Tolypothrix bouteillei]KAF3884056.1 hypothetical protein DA73_0400035040 [Tolypothrix bouteillei VB521301]
MTVQLSQLDFQRLTRIVHNLPDFANVRDRTRWLPISNNRLVVSSVNQTYI